MQGNYEICLFNKSTNLQSRWLFVGLPEDRPLLLLCGGHHPALKASPWPQSVFLGSGSFQIAFMASPYLVYNTQSVSSSMLLRTPIHQWEVKMLWVILHIMALLLLNMWIRYFKVLVRLCCSLRSKRYGTRQCLRNPLIFTKMLFAVTADQSHTHPTYPPHLQTPEPFALTQPWGQGPLPGHSRGLGWTWSKPIT